MKSIQLLDKESIKLITFAGKTVRHGFPLGYFLASDEIFLVGFFLFLNFSSFRKLKHKLHVLG